MSAVLIAANWKMYKTAAEAEAFFGAWSREAVPPGREVAFFPPFTLIHVLRGLLPPGQGLGGQHCHEAREGAFTGEVSAAMLADEGCSYVLVGHSERRHVFCEEDDRVASKFAAALRHGLRPVLCVGERLEERQAGGTLRVVLGQLEAGLGEAPPESGFDVAYEPVWAIGTGRVARPADAAEVHAAIRVWLVEHRAGADARVLYGGSVKPDNAAELLAAEEVGGLLVGGASLDVAAFAAIVRAGT
jgi:triosephosphate isomerase